MDMQDALAKAKAIAAKFAGNAGGITSAPVSAPPASAPTVAPAAADSALGKRRWDADLNRGGSSGGVEKKPNVADIYGPGATGGTSNHELEIRIPNQMVGIVIGKGGETITRLQTMSGANMQIEKEHEMKPGETHRRIYIRGRREACEDLQRRVEEMVTNQQMKDNQHASARAGVGAKPQEKEMNYPFIMKAPVPNDRVGVIIGRQGATIKFIQDKTRTNIQIPQVADADNPEVRTLCIGGYTKEAIDAAQMEIFMQLQQFQQQGSTPKPTPAPTNMLYIHVPDDRVGLIIGKGGTTIKEIQNRNAVRIQIPSMADPGTYPPMRSVSLQGSHESQYASKYEIEMLLNLPPNSLAVVGDPATSGGAAAGGYGAYSQQGAAGAYAQQAAYGAYPAAQYGAAYGAPAQAVAAAPAAAAGQDLSGGTQAQQVPTDPTAYYNDFWQYAAYYGEAAARAYYQQWSPPEGSVPPTQAGAGQQAVTAAAAEGNTGETATDASSANGSESAAKNEASATDGNDPTSDGPATESSQEAATDSGAAEGVNKTDEAAAVETSADGKSATPAEAVAASSAGTESAGGGTDDAWEAYKKQYAEWWNAYGRASGAPEDPAAAYASQQPQ